jgi:hypothetical protein
LSLADFILVQIIRRFTAYWFIIVPLIFAEFGAFRTNFAQISRYKNTNENCDCRGRIMNKKLSVKHTIRKRNKSEEGKSRNPETIEERNKVIKENLFENEYFGKEFSEIDRKYSYRPPYENTFRLRIIPYSDGRIEICFNTEKSETYTKIIHEGLTPQQASEAFNLYCNEIIHYLNDTAHILFTTCIERQNPNINQRRELLETWIETLSVHYRRILGLGYEKQIGVNQENGIEQEVWKFVDEGRPNQTKEQYEKKRREFINNILDSFKQIEEENGKITKTNVGSIIFADEIEKNGELDISSRMKYYLRIYKLNFEYMITCYNSKVAIK